MASDTSPYHIYHIDEIGELIKKFDHTEGRAACLLDSTPIIQAILKTDAANSAFIQVGKEYYAYDPKAWFEKDLKGTQEEKIKRVVRDFLGMFKIPVFPDLLISDRLRHLDTPASTLSAKWKMIFPMTEQRILINGRRLQMMLDTRMRLDSAEDKEGHIRNAYRVYQFQFAVTILHEIGHVFNTYLSKGIGDTPPSPGGTVEAGFRLEKLMFGEKIHFLRDRKAGDSDCGAGWPIIKRQTDEDEFDYYKVTKEAIDDIVDMKFQLPFGDIEATLVGDEYEDACDIWLKLEEGEDEDEQTEDPAKHPEYALRLEKIDPGRRREQDLGR